MGSGRTIALSLPRRLVSDLVHFAHKAPTVPVQRIINVAAVGRQRAMTPSRPGWCAIFTKAMAIVSQDMPELRRAYLSFPWARLYEHSESIASVAMEREYHGENGVFFAHFIAPDRRSLADLDAELRRLKGAPIESVPEFRMTLAICRLPRFLRRFAWWYITHFRGYRKATWLGTFGVSVYSSLGAESLHPLSPVTTTLNYGVLQPNGDLAVRLIYDHRVMDGSTVARALARLDQVLNTEILAELRSMSAAVA